MALASRVAAIFLFNHKFERNVPRLEEIYGSRFSTRKYIMPFATSDDSRVIPVLESSYTFSGHLAQARLNLIDPAITHYVVISDDLIVNPAINEHNIVEQLGLGDRYGYIKSLASLDGVRYRWWRALEVANAFRRAAHYFDYAAELPPANDARARFEQMGIEFPKPSPRSLRECRFALTKMLTSLDRRDVPTILTQQGKASAYPFLVGYADFLVIPGYSIEQFLHYCGVFAALNVFSEVAVPTALALAAEHVVTELELNEMFDDPAARRKAGANWKGTEFWQRGEEEAFALDYENCVTRLQSEFPENWLYVHPVKLSKWRL
jgi:hypothetical protein